MTDMDEARLAETFRAAAGAAPPAGFDHADVVRASRRATARRRAAVAGSALAVVAVIGVGVAVTAPGGGNGRDASVAAAPVPAPDGAPEAAAGGQERSGPADAGPPEAPLGPSEGECAPKQDPALRALVEQALPETADATEAPVTLECAPGGSRAVHLEVEDGGVAGLLVVQYLPPGQRPRPGAPDARGDEIAYAAAATASGGEVAITSTRTGPGERPPFADRLAAAAAVLAPRL
ncbi:MAG TPA: hypothetical protein VM367_02285 [Pseudonocardia sp.]|jgi:hypothetical protein|nr:hypothetical protein [Pseudonocardia sp.]